MENFQFVLDNSFDKRKSISDKIRSTHPNSIPSIVETSNSSIGLRKHKFIIPFDISVAQFMMSVRKHIDTMNDKEALFFMTVSDNHQGGIMLIGSYSILEVYEKYQSSDGFLYIRLEKENVFGF
jgi:hypothetical protein